MMNINVNPGAQFDRMLTITAELFFDTEYELLLKPLIVELTERNPRPAVLDVGSGNGAYLSLLSRRHPELTCIGLEKDTAIVPYAKEKEQHSNVRFLPIAYEDYEDKQVYDLILVRLAAIHLHDRRHFAEWLKRRTKPGSVIVIIDADDSFSDASGSRNLPLFHSMYTEARRKLSVSQWMRFQDVLSIEFQHAGLQHHRLLPYQVEGRTPEKKQRMRSYMEAVTLLHSCDMSDPERVREWDAWAANEMAGYSIGMFGLVLIV